MSRLHALARAHGIGDAYHDIGGGYHETGDETRLALLRAMRVNPHAPPEAPADGPTVDALVVREGEHPWLPVRIGEVGGRWTWCCTLEDGDVREGVVVVEGEPEYVEIALLAPLGTHQLDVRIADTVHSIHLTVAPARCYLPDDFGGRRRVWGVALQLYALRSRSNWGIGDFADLTVAVEVLAELGADVVGLSPLHALYPYEPERASPYSPSSRRFLNPLFVRPEQAAHYAAAGDVRAYVRSAAVQAELRRLRASELVDYGAVARLKLDVLRRLFEHFDRVRPNREWAAFEAFVEAGGAMLRRFAAHELRCRLQRDNVPLTEPDCARGAAALDALAYEYPDDVRFHAYLQWLARAQLDAVAACASRMAIGLYTDLAVGVSADGADACLDADALASGVSIGAPPDAFSPDGQVWGLLAPSPAASRAARYAAFRDTLAANMRGAGALRIDHVMGLLRLYWVPEGEPATRGAYVHYDVEALLGILALESQRHACVVIGEDLGTVPDALRAAIYDCGLLSYRLMLFERHWHDGGEMKGPHDYPEQATASFATHDLATLHGFVARHDLDTRRNLDRLGGDDAYAERDHDVARIGRALAAEGLDDAIDSNATEQLPAVLDAVHTFLARTPSRIALARVEDVLGQLEQVNLPATIDEYPNWRRRLSLDVEAWRDAPEFARLAAAFGERS